MADLVFLAGGGNNLLESAIIPSVTLSVSHSMENAISKFPIEKSTDGSYNTVVRNNVITIKGAFSNIHLQGVLFENSTPDVLSSQIIDNKNRPQAAFDLIKDARDTVKFLDIVTGYTTYKDCLIKTFSVQESKDTGNILSFELSTI